MTKTDREYLNLLQDIIDNGVEKDTRAGRVKSVFGRQIRFNLKEGLPLLTTKKVFTKGVIRELLWFLQHPCNSHGSMNIEYLVRNNVHIWDDDAYRWFKSEIVPQFKGKIRDIVVCLSEDDGREIVGEPSYEYWISAETKKNDDAWLESITKEEFLNLVIQRVELRGSWMSKYRFGDLGAIYGTQWRSYGESGKDQIKEVINTLKTNPNDRRMLVSAWNTDVIGDVALPPCHVMFQFYTRRLSNKERMEIFNERYANGEIPQKYHEWFDEYSKHTKEGMDVQMPNDGSDFDMADIPKYGLSCMWVQRSVDVPLGLCWNISSYGFLTYMIAKLVNMVPDELIGSLGDCHIYLNQIEGVQEQLKRKGSDKTPKLKIKRKVKDIDDFKFEDFEIADYESDSPIKLQLSVGL